ncbi:MAG: hypothetical protein AMJ43_01430 [Coxiella sp. DG_40]|nr:MAG: hypothetical protein AMJ43_01430 [Coxiella sp. DG_40]
MRKKWIIAFCFVAILLIAGEITLKHYINSQEIKKLLNDPIKLNKYIAEHQPFSLTDTKIENHDLNGIKLINGKINNTEWTAVNAQKSQIDNVIIKNGVFKDVNFSYSSMNKVTFDHASFDHAKFNHSILKNISFIDCRFITSSFNNLVESEIFFERSDINDNDFYKSQMRISLKDTLINNIDMSLLKLGSNFIMQDGELKNIRMSKAHLDEFKLDRVKTSNVDFSEGEAKNVFLKNSTIDINMPKTQINTIYISKGEMIMFSPGYAPIDQAIITDCDVSNDISFFGSKINLLNIANCKVDSLSFGEAKINILKLKNITINKESLSPRAKIVKAYLDDVKINGNIDLHNTIIKNLYVHDFHYNPNAKVKTDDSNLEYSAHGLKLKGLWPEVTSDKWLIFHWGENS